MPIPNSASATYTAQAEPDAVDFDIISAAPGGYGVASGCACTPNASGSTLVVAVSAGTIFVGSAIPQPVTAGTATPGAAHSTNPRFDLVVADTVGALSIVAGTAAANPVFPTVPANRVVLAAVYIPAAATSITASNIVDKRQMVTFARAPQGVATAGEWGAELRGWRAAWANRNTTPVNILLLGDSNTVGYWASTDPQRWAQVFSHSMQTAAGGYPSTGWQPHHSITNYTLPWTDSGTISDNSLSGLGYGAVNIPGTGTSGSITATQTCDRFWVVYSNGTGIGPFSVTVDNMVIATVTPSSGTRVGGQIWDSGPLPRGSHTVKIATTTTTATVFEGLQWFDGNGPTHTTAGAPTGAQARAGKGVRVFNAAKFGSSASDFAAAAGGGTWWTDNLDKINPHIVMMAWGTNDSGAAVAPETYRANLLAIIDRINTVMAAASLPNPSYVLVIPHGTGSTGTISRYATATYRAAADRGCAVVDRYQLMGELDTPGVDPYGYGSSFDGVTARKHLSDTGMRAAGENLAEFLLSAVNRRTPALSEGPLVHSNPLTLERKQLPVADNDPAWQNPVMRGLRAAWANRASKPVTLMLLGDSVSQGYYASTFDKSFMGILYSRLCQLNGQPVAAGYVSLSTQSSGAYIGRDFTKANCTDNNNYGVGYNASTLASTSPGPAGTATISMLCDRIWVHYPQAPSGLGTFNITIDGVSQGTITPTGTARGGRVWDSGALTRDTHTLTITANSTTAAVVEGASFFDGNGNTSGTVGALTSGNAETGSGVRLVNAAHFAFTAANYAVAPNGTNWWTDGFDMLYPDAVFINLGVNDCTGRTQQQFHDDLVTIINRIRAVMLLSSQLPCTIVIVSPYGVGSYDAMPPFTAVARQVAVEKDCAFVDWYSLMGYVGTSTVDTYTLMSALDGPTAKLHPSDTGHQLIGDNLSQFVVSSLGPTGQIPRPGVRKIKTAGRTVADGVLNTTTTVTSATAAFVAGDVGRQIIGIGIPRGTTIASVTNGTTAVMSAAATSSATGVTLALNAAQTAINIQTDDMIFADCTAVSCELAMPAPAGNVGQQIGFKKLDNTANELIVYTTGGTKIEDNTEVRIRVDAVAIQFMSDGTNWWAV